MKKMIVTFLLTAVASVSSAQMTLDQAIATATENNLTLRNAQIAVDSGRQDLLAMRTKRLPQFSMDTLGSEMLTPLSFSFEKGAFGNYGTTGPIPDKDTKIDVARTFNVVSIARVTQPITQLHKINLGIQAKDAALSITKEQERAAKQSVVREVKRAYFGVLHAESAVTAANENVKLYEEITRETEQRVAQRVSLETDRLDSRAGLTNAKVSAMVASNSLNIARQQFNYLLGRELSTPVELADMPIVPPTPLPQTAVDRRPDVRQGKLQVEQAQLDVRVKNAERIPDVSIEATYLAPINVGLVSSNMASAAIVISYEPFTWGRRSAELAQKRNVVSQAENALRDTKLKAEIEIADRANKVAEAAVTVEARRLEKQTARERLRIVRARYEQQASRLDDLFGASAQLAQANARETEAIANYWTARADYEKALGED